jgi:hypothetical protein
MMQASELKNKYRELVSAPVTITEYNEDGESVSLLFENEWVRILVIRQNDVSDITIEVESSLPQKCGTSPSSSKSSKKETKQILLGALNHLQYLQELGEIGFDLEVISQDCLWTASQIFTKEIDLSVFEKLCPPKEKNTS